jgi:hypothetical protein
MSCRKVELLGFKYVRVNDICQASFRGRVFYVRIGSMRRVYWR